MKTNRVIMSLQERKKIDTILNNDNLSKKEALSIINSFHDILKIDENDYAAHEGYRYKDNSSKPLFGYLSAFTFAPSTLLHEFGHAIELIENNEPSRILDNTFGMEHYSEMHTQYGNFPFHITTEAIKRECRTIAIQSILTEKVLGITDREYCLEQHIEKFGGALHLMEDFINIKVNEKDITKADKLRNEKIKEWIRNYYEEFRNINTDDKINTVNKIRNNKMSKQYLKENAFYYIHVPSIVEELNVFEKLNINISDMIDKYDAAYNNRTVDLNDIEKDIIEQTLDFKGKTINVKSKNKETMLNEDDLKHIAAAQLISRVKLKATINNYTESNHKFAYPNRFQSILIENNKKKMKYASI